MGKSGIYPQEEIYPERKEGGGNSHPALSFGQII